MKAVGVYRYLPITDPESLLDLEVQNSSPTGRDLLVKVEAISVNPGTSKCVHQSQRWKPHQTHSGLGTPRERRRLVGSDCTIFKHGDKVYYAGSVTRPGCDSEFHVVDDRIVGNMPKTLTFAQALPCL